MMKNIHTTARPFFFAATCLVLVVISNALHAEQKVALLAAVTSYEHATMNAKPLEYPEADAKALAEVLRASGYKVVLLVGNEATQAAVRRELLQIKQEGDQSGVLILGFFGHGVQYGESAYFCPYDTKLRDVVDKDNKILRHTNGSPREEPDPASLISMREMLDALSRSPAGSKLLLADCCREDPNTARGSLKGRAFGSALRVDQLPKNCAALFACSEGEQAFEHKDWQHGAFTKALLNSIATGQRITANGLSESVYVGVEELVTPKGERQRVNSLLAGGLIDLKLRASPRATPHMKTVDKLPSSSTPATPPSSARSFVNSVGATMILIPAGSFMMGSPDSDTEAADREKPQHRVTLTRAYYMGETEVTQGQWKAVMRAEPWKGKEYLREGANYPATPVSWDDAVEYCRRLSEREGRTYRLPTEAEWEYACRGGKSTRYSFGDNAIELSRYGWFDENANEKSEEVKQKLANPFGMYDMHGNVSEWCSDWWVDKYTSGAVTDPIGPNDSQYRVGRGGSWSSTAGRCRSAYRYGFSPTYRFDGLGFRLVSVSQ